MDGSRCTPYLASSKQQLNQETKQAEWQDKKIIEESPEEHIGDPFAEEEAEDYDNSHQ